ncbi:hypothetical protein ZWY2020_011682 [Hordeum vulgare]|nr:hypothetical protein ZWY2020_011682 [Hordeum vulgare]
MVGAPTSSVVNVYPLANYTFGTKEPKMEGHLRRRRLARMKVKCKSTITPHTVVQGWKHICKLPGGRLKPGENAVIGPVISTIPQQLSRFQFNMHY